MKKGTLFFAVLVFFVLNACGNYAKKTTTYESLKFVSEIRENDLLSIIDINSTSFPISLIWFKEYEKTFVKVNNRYLLIELDWILNDGEYPEIDIISLFKKKDDYILMFPTYTEEFPVYGIINISENGTYKDLGFHTYSYSDFDKAKDEMLDGSYRLNEVNDTVRILLKSSPEVMLSDIMYTESLSESISENEKAIIQILLSDDPPVRKVNNNESTVK